MAAPLCAAPGSYCDRRRTRRGDHQSSSREQRSIQPAQVEHPGALADLPTQRRRTHATPPSPELNREDRRETAPQESGICHKRRSPTPLSKRRETLSRAPVPRLARAAASSDRLGYCPASVATSFQLGSREERSRANVHTSVTSVTFSGLPSITLPDLSRVTEMSWETNRTVRCAVRARNSAAVISDFSIATKRVSTVSPLDSRSRIAASNPS